MQKLQIAGNIIDVKKRKIFSGTLAIENGKIKKIIQDNKKYSNYILPGFIDSHIHIESTLLTPQEFSRIVVQHGTIAVVADPHEIANVGGLKAVDFFIKQAEKSSLKIFFSVPSCVPATKNETNGAELSVSDVEILMQYPQVKALAEMMNFPGVLNFDKEIIAKINTAKKYRKPIDGHAPGLKGSALKQYIGAGISTDHEVCFVNEALERIDQGMYIQIREGSAAKNFDELHSLIKTHSEKCMFCSDDKHPDELIIGHINELVKKSLDLGYNIFDVLTIATINPIEHYKLDVGLLQEGDPADFIVIDNLTSFKILETYINGEKIFSKGTSLIPISDFEPINNFNIGKLSSHEFSIKTNKKFCHVIEIEDGSLFTKNSIHSTNIKNGIATTSIEKDILKIVIVNRYFKAKPAIAFIKGFGLKSGAIASSVAHDSHNIIAVGVSDEEICKAINIIIEHKGGLSIANKENIKILPLPFAGLMSIDNYENVASNYSQLQQETKLLGTKLKSPFMTLSFMGLTVIPELKLSDKGLFDSLKFEFVDLFVSL